MPCVENYNWLIISIKVRLLHRAKIQLKCFVYTFGYYFGFPFSEGGGGLLCVNFPTPIKISVQLFLFSKHLHSTVLLFVINCSGTVLFWYSLFFFGTITYPLNNLNRFSKFRYTIHYPVPCLNLIKLLYLFRFSVD